MLAYRCIVARVALLAACVAPAPATAAAAAAAAAAASAPLLPIVNATSAWAPPNPALPYPVGPNPGLAWAPAPPRHAQGAPPRTRRQPPAPANKQGLLLGDIRAHLKVTATAAQSAASVTAQIYWRRRDHMPAIKAVVVTDSAGAQVRALAANLFAESKPHRPCLTLARAPIIMLHHHTHVTLAPL